MEIWFKVSLTLVVICGFFFVSDSIVFRLNKSPEWYKVTRGLSCVACIVSSVSYALVRIWV